MNPTTGAGMELVIESGTQTGKRFSLDRPLTTIGRAQDNDIVLNDEMVSKHHTRIIIQGNNFLIEDLGSSNGTIVNGQNVNNHLLAEGDRVYLGQTNLAFHSPTPAAVTAPMDAVPAAAAAAVAAPVSAPVTASRKKGVWIAAGIAGGLVILAVIAIVLVLVLKGGKDSIKPAAKFNSPASGLGVELGLPVGTPKQVDVAITASDNKGLDKVEILVNDKVVETLKATTATRESKIGGKLKEEDFAYKWSTNAPGDYTLRAKTYDWKGNTGDSDPITVKVVYGPEVDQAHKFCQQFDGLITEFVRYRSDFNRAYIAAKEGTDPTRYAQAGLVFNQVRNERISIQTRLSSLPPPPAFAPCHSLFNQQVSAAVQADELAILWARDMQSNLLYYESGYMPNPDPNDYDGKMKSASGASQQAAAALNEAYNGPNGARATQLKIEPGPNPTD